jgi:hypothetical protein
VHWIPCLKERRNQNSKEDIITRPRFVGKGFEHPSVIKIAPKSPNGLGRFNFRQKKASLGDLGSSKVASILTSPTLASARLSHSIVHTFRTRRMIASGMSWQIWWKSSLLNGQAVPEQIRKSERNRRWIRSVSQHSEFTRSCSTKLGIPKTLLCVHWCPGIDLRRRDSRVN